MKANIFLALGLALLVVAAVLAFGTMRSLRGAQRAEGEVIALNAGGSHPQIRFRLPDGRAISYPQGGWIGGYAVGDRVTVLYEAAAPLQTARIDAIGSVWAWSIAAAAIGLIFALAGIFGR